MKKRTSQSSPALLIILIVVLSMAWPGAAQNVAKQDELSEELATLVSRPGKHFMVLEVTNVEAHTSEALVVLASHGDSGKRIEPKAGWRVSSRAPKDSWQFMP